MRSEIIEQVKKHRVIAIVRGVESTQCRAVAEALYRGGIRLLEITYDQKRPETWDKTAEAIHDLVISYQGKMFIGAGTVTSRELVRLTAQAGGEFIVSPNSDQAVITCTRDLDLVSIPGALTPSEILHAHTWGADFVKLFPAAALGIGYLKAIRAPISHVDLLATGGIHAANAKAFLEAGAAGLGVGGSLADKMQIEAGAYDKLTEAAENLLAAIV